MLAEVYVFKGPWKRLAAFCFDALGTVFLGPFSLFSRPLDPRKVSRILAIRLDHVGDAVMTKPALAALHRHFPHAAVDLLVSAGVAPLFEDESEIHEIIRVEKSWFTPGATGYEILRELRRVIRSLKEKKYDLAIDFRGDLRNILLMTLAGIPQRIGYGITGGGFLLTQKGRYSRQKHQVLLNVELLQACGVKGQDLASARLSYSGSRKRAFWNRFVEVLPPTGLPRIAIHAGASSPAKRWPALKFGKLIKKIAEDKLGEIVLIGTQEEKRLLHQADLAGIPFVDLRGQTALAELPIFFDGCDLFIGNDSGPAHLAAAQGIEVLVISSGTSDSRAWHPWTERLNLVKHEVPCSPCEARECPLKHHDCMEKITAEEVYSRVVAILSRKELLAP